MFDACKQRLTALISPAQKVAKRLVYALSQAQSEQMGQQQYQEAVRPLGDRIQALLSSSDIRRDVRAAVQSRVQAVQRLIQPMITANQGHPDTIRDLQQVQQQVTNRLGTLQNQLLMQLSLLGVTDQARTLQRSYQQRYRDFVTRLLGASASSASAPSSTVPPARVSGSAGGSPTGRTHQPSRGSLDTGRTSVPTTRYEINERFEAQLMGQFYRFTTTWAGEQWVQGERVPNGAIQEFGRKMWHHLTHQSTMRYQGHTGKNAALAFIAEKMGGPTATNANNAMKDIVRGGYLAYVAYGVAQRAADPQLAALFRNNPRNAHRQVRRGFFNGLTINTDSTMNHSNASIRSYITAHYTPAVAAAQTARRTQELRTRRDEIQAAVGRTTPRTPLQQADIGRSIENASVTGPSGEHLAQFVHTGQTLLDAGFPRDQLTWENIQSARINGRTLRIGNTSHELSVTTVPTGTGIGARDQVTVRGPQSHNTDLYAFVTALQSLRRDYGDQFQDRFQGPINLSETAALVNLESTRREMGQRQYRSFLENNGLSGSDLERSGRMNEVLTRLLGVDRRTTRTAAEWSQAINDIRLNPSISRTDFQTMFALKFMVKTRIVSGSAMNIEAYTNALLSSQQVRAIPTPGRIQLTKHVLVEHMAYLIVNRHLLGTDVRELIRRTNNEAWARHEAEHALEHAPGFGEIIRFFGSYSGEAVDRQGRPFSPRLNLMNSDWQVTKAHWDQLTMRARLNPNPSSDLLPLSENVANGHGNEMIPRRTVEEYMRLQRENPYFRAITSMPANQAPGHTLQSMVGYYLLPMATLE